MVLRQLGALTLVATAIGVSGCGGSGASNSTSNNSASDPAHALSSAELIAKGDAICARVSGQVGATPVSTPQDIIRLTPRLAAYDRAGAADLAKLVPPGSLVRDWQQIVAGMRTLAENTAGLGAAYSKGNTSLARAVVATSLTIEKQLAAIARRDGFKHCMQ